MISFVHYGRHSYTHKELQDCPGLCRIGIGNYHQLLNCKLIPPATYIFTDRERMDLTELRVFSALFKYINGLGEGYRAINDPARMLNRRSLLRTLYTHGMNDFNVYAVTERIDPKRFPVFVRREYDHGKPLTDLLYSQEELDNSLNSLRESGEPEDGLLIVEYCAEPIAGKLFRKLSAYKIGNQVLFYNAVHEENWLVKYGTINAATEALYQEEQKMVLENAYEEHLHKAFKLAGIDYGRADFGIVNGRVQIYEINTNPNTKRPIDHPSPVRVQTQILAWNHYCEALNVLSGQASIVSVANKFTHPNLNVNKTGASVFRT